MKRKKIKICFISSFAYPLFNPKCKVVHGGSEVQLFQLGKELSRDEKFEVIFFVWDFGQKRVEMYENIKVIKQRFTSSFWANRRGGNMLFKIYNVILMLVEKPQIFVVRGASPDLLFYAKMCQFINSKLVFMTAHDFDVNGNYKKYFPREGKLFEKALVSANFIICQSEFQKLQLKKNYNRYSIVIRNSFPIPGLSNCKNKSFILWVARLVSDKQPAKYIELAKKFPNEKFVMIAPGGEKSALEQKILRLASSSNNLIFIRHVPFEKISDYFKKAKVFVNTSIEEGFPNTFVQAAIYSTPIISLNVNPDNFLNKYNCGYFAEGDDEKMRKFLENLLADEGKWKKMSNNVYEYAKKEHDLAKNGNKFKQYLISL